MISAKSELCLFDRPSPQAVIEHGAFEDIYPRNSITDAGSSSIQFYINGSQTEYLDLNDTLLYIQLKVVNNLGENLGESEVIPNNFFFQTLFKDVELIFNSIKVEGSNDRFAHKALIETLINYDGDTKRTSLGGMGYTNKDLTRKTWIEKSKSFSLCSPLQFDFFDQPKYLLPGVSVQIKLTRSNPTLSLTCAKIEPKIVLLDAKLMVRRVRVEPSVLAGHQIGLSTKNAIYPLRSKEVVDFSLPIGSSSFYKEQIFGDRRLPNFILVAFQSSKRFSGSFSESFSIFDHFNVKSITLSKGSDYREKYSQDFENDDYSTSYMQSIIRNMGYLNKNMNCGITMSDFKSKYPFFTFVLAPDFDLHQSQLPQSGNLRLDIKFASSLTEAVSVIVYGVFEKEIQITSTRTVLV